MAKRKSRNKNFANRRAAEATVAQRREAVTTSVRNFVIGLVGISILAIGAYFLIQFLTASEETETAATESLNSELAVSDAASEESAGTQIQLGSDVAVEPQGTLLELDRPLTEVDPIDRNGYYSSAPEMMIDTSKSYQALVETDQGEMLIQLFDDEAPITVNNFVFLATQGFYDDLTFHRVIPDFMVQGGDPAGVGNGGPGYSFEDEFDPSLRFDRRGLLAMANSGPATNGSQFFITHVPTDWLNDAHTIFGELISGDDTLGAIPITGEPGSPAKIIRIDIYES